MIRLQQLFIALLAVFIISFYMIFWAFFHEEKQSKAQIIVTDLHSTMTDLSFIINQDLKSWSDFSRVRPVLNQIASNHPNIDDIIVAHQNAILISTNPGIRDLPNNAHKVHEAVTANHLIDDLNVHQHSFSVYIDGQPQLLKIFAITNPKMIHYHFQEMYEQFIFYLILPTFGMAVLLYLVLHRFVLFPLLNLRIYAERPLSNRPRSIIQEVESITGAVETSRKNLSLELEAQHSAARKDALTDLANRVALQEYIELLTKQKVHRATAFSVFFLDLDNFKYVNDTLGHDVGDQLLVRIAEILRTINPKGLTARIGGDEFIMVINRAVDEEVIINYINPILSRLQNIREIEGHPIAISSSIGISQFPKDGRNHNELLKNADIALFEAKKHGKSRHWLFNDQLNEQIQNHVKMENSLKLALDNHEFQIFFQPQVDILSNRIIGVESLIRWYNPDLGHISPADFIPVAEQTGLMPEVGFWVLESAIEKLQYWLAHNMELTVSINVSPSQLVQSDFISSLAQLLDSYRVPPHLLHIEITETILMLNTADNMQTLKELQQLGVHIALDDFGTGFSSLAYLKEFPINILKIDKAFIDDIDTKDGKTFVQTIINMANTLKLDIIAEGVETESQRDTLIAMGCPVYQGYLCSQPINASDFKEKFFEFNHQAKT